MMHRIWAKKSLKAVDESNRASSVETSVNTGFSNDPDSLLIGARVEGLPGAHPSTAESNSSATFVLLVSRLSYIQIDFKLREYKL